MFPYGFSPPWHRDAMRSSCLCHWDFVAIRNHQRRSLRQPWVFMLVVEPTHLKNMLVNMSSSSPNRGENNKYLKPPTSFRAKNSWISTKFPKPLRTYKMESPNLVAFQSRSKFWPVISGKPLLAEATSGFVDNHLPTRLEGNLCISKGYTFVTLSNGLREHVIVVLLVNLWFRYVWRHFFKFQVAFFINCLKGIRKMSSDKQFHTYLLGSKISTWTKTSPYHLNPRQSAAPGFWDAERHLTPILGEFLMEGVGWT